MFAVAFYYGGKKSSLIDRTLRPDVKSIEIVQRACCGSFSGREVLRGMRAGGDRGLPGDLVGDTRLSWIVGGPKRAVLDKIVDSTRVCRVHLTKG